ncbi:MULTISPECIES: glycosyltransferase [Fischerella]|uniref:Glycosyl transferase family 1 n=1 Tax=Fischerella muscicola CCMEE 5323 TaxID=2019572 RepID=A0A2N6JWE0_FISMU|nr:MULTISPECIES: glycosyltransferase [Fischerella]MBD2432488.1 glycosyltransferase [Fischerella sp. FACHB-380]PLZ84385.1 glycosyl transferase family 1 [Fischerella muscicola CCMEE 5323]
MTHFGIICPPYPGHINPQAALARELQSRGHRVTFVQIPDLESKVESEGVNFYPIGKTIYQPGSMSETFVQLGKLSAIEALRYSLDFCQQMVEIVCQDAPKAIATAGIEVLLVDQLEPVGETVAEYLNLPFICISCGQVIHRRGDVPPFFTPWNYQNTHWAKIRNQVAYYFLDRSCQPILQAINRYRQEWKLPEYRHIYASNARLAHISQQPGLFEFPIPNLPSHLHYVGPLRNASPKLVSFPYEKLTGQPMIYASLGSVQNTKQEVFSAIATASLGLDVQLVIAHGGGMSAEVVRSLPGSPLVVEYAPQPDVLAHASLTITHAGMNTTLDSLTYGVPLVAIPITFEQPGTGARIRSTGVGEVFPLAKLSISTLRSAIKRVLTEDSYKKNAPRIQQSIQLSGGVKRAADIVEQVTKKGRGQKAGSMNKNISRG